MKKEFTEKELAWIKKFEGVLRSMPKTLEIAANHGTTSIFNKGAKAKSFEKCGDGDNIEYYAEKCYQISKSPIEPNGESL